MVKYQVNVYRKTNIKDFTLAGLHQPILSYAHVNKNPYKLMVYSATVIYNSYTLYILQCISFCDFFILNLLHEKYVITQICLITVLIQSLTIIYSIKCIPPDGTSALCRNQSISGKYFNPYAQHKL